MSELKFLSLSWEHGSRGRSTLEPARGAYLVLATPSGKTRRVHLDESALARLLAEAAVANKNYLSERPF